MKNILFFVTIVFTLLLSSNQSFSFITSTHKTCPTYAHVNAYLDFDDDLQGPSYQSYELAGNLNESYKKILDAGQYQLTAVMFFEGTKKVKGRIRCIYSTQGIVVKGNNFVEKIPGRSKGSGLESWLLLSKDEKSIERVSAAKLYLTSVHDIQAMDGKTYPVLYTAFGLTLYGNNMVESTVNSTTFTGTLTEIDYSSGHRHFAKSKVTITTLNPQDVNRRAD